MITPNWIGEKCDASGLGFDIVVGARQTEQPDWFEQMGLLQ